jgi:hypothetical protein
MKPRGNGAASGRALRAFFVVVAEAATCNPGYEGDDLQRGYQGHDLRGISYHLNS